MEFIESYELLSFPPNRRTFYYLNELNKDVEFDLEVGDSFVPPHNADFYIVFEVIGPEGYKTH